MTSHRPGVEWDVNPANKKERIWRLTCATHGYVGRWVSQMHGPVERSRQAVAHFEQHLAEKREEPLDHQAEGLQTATLERGDGTSQPTPPREEQ